MSSANLKKELPNLKRHYRDVVVPKLMQERKYKNVMQVPAIKKVTLNMGLGEAMSDKKIIENAVEQLSAIAGQKAVVTRARKSIAGFKLREGWPIGCKVTLRRDRMYEFLERLLSVAIPRIRDFRGLNKNSFDAQGNYSMGVQEQIIFPEIKYDKIDALRGLNITITTSASSKADGLALLKAFNFPIKEV